MVNPKYPWPPSLIVWNSDWASYSKLIYAAYKEAFNWSNPLLFEGMPIRTRKKPIENGMEGGFWHVIGGADGIPDRERCERVVWARVVVENYNRDDILVWEEPSHHDGRVMDVVFWAKDLDYYVILARRNGYWLLRSAYCVKYDSKRRKLQEAYNRFGPYKNWDRQQS